VADSPPILRSGDNAFCMTNTRVLIYFDGYLKFDGENETFWSSLDEKIQNF